MMALNPALKQMVAEAKAKFRATHPEPDTFIDDIRFGRLVDVLKLIEETDDEARDRAITEALIEIGSIAPNGYREFYG